VDRQSRNRALVRYVLLPTIFLTVALLGGVRVASETGALLFVAPPLVTLILAVMLVALFSRAGAIELDRWLSADNTAAANVSHALTLVALFFASAQCFNTVLPEAGLLRWILSFFFLWTLWQNQFARFDVRRLLRGLVALFGTAFIIKHVLLASFNAPESSLFKRLASALLEGVTLGSLGGESLAPATGYISFFTLALYVCGLLLLSPAPEEDLTQTTRADEVVRAIRQLPPDEREQVCAAILDDERETEVRSPQR
jgi:hypothetical protein